MAAPIKIGELLLSQGVLTQKQLQIALEQQQVTGAILGDLLIRLGFITAPEFARTIAVQSGLEYLDLSEFEPEEEALRLIPKETAEKIGVIPLALVDGHLTIGITNPSNIVAVDTATKVTGKPPKVYLVDNDHYQSTLEKAYYFIAHPIQKRMQEIITQLRQITGVVPGATISELVELIMMDGIRKQATDIHISPTEDVTNIFYRIDGVLQHGHCIQKQAHAGIVSRIKILGQLDIAEQRLPQDGSFSHTFLSKSFEVRVSTVPSIFGENLVLRLLAGAGPLLRLEALGISSVTVQQVRSLFNKSYGIILIAGPTGSGKTTTLYAALRELNRLERNILTVEDPVEYRLSFVKQTQVNEKAGYDFALAARNFMRQDPDVMLLGEIRDEETAQMAVRAAITGHLVLSTLHTNDAATAIPRLLDLKVDTFLLSSALVAVIAQRLVRKNCKYCSEEYLLSDDERQVFRQHRLDTTKGRRGAGCSKCGNSGFSGRVSICEVLVVDSRIRQLIFEGASTGTIMELAVAEGMIPLQLDGINKAAAGVTTLAEVLRVAG
ncbi:MAG: GspE/PulE family protein [Trichlorobacter sp.]|uniref:GspE/PulE family protein n=1 Tax=Trichlorobacter sp. TaxID=2911007 RepID=UPI002561B370|nr:GspE/PulE family protein [Trichlorobacter sp.]MDK9719384.1 GspE/PulE family protein [Trichlorobacter sp.]